MTLRHASFVIPASYCGNPEGIPVLVLGGSETGEIEQVPVPTSLMGHGSVVVPYHRAQPVIGAVPVSDLWRLAADTYGDERGAVTKVVLLLEPVEGDVAAAWAPVATGTPEDGMPSLTHDLFNFTVHTATRDLRISSGGILAVDQALDVPGQLPEWAERIAHPR